MPATHNPGFPEPLEVESVTVNQERVVGGNSLSGTVTINQVATTTTNRVILQGSLADGSSTVTPSAEFFIMPTAQTDLIEVTKATLSKRGH